MTKPDDAPDAVTDDEQTTADPSSEEPTAESTEPSSEEPTAESTEPSSEETVATGILAAERRAQEQIARRRRLLVGGAVLGLVIAAAVLATMALLQQQANTEAQLASDRAEARADFAAAVVAQAEDYQPPVRIVETDAGELRTTLEQFLSETETSDDELARRVEVGVTRLQAVAASMEELTGRDVPAPPGLVAEVRAVEVLRELETLRAEARALVDEIPLAINDAQLWLGVVRDVNQAVADHVAEVEAEESTSNPTELIDLWRAERPALLRLSASASAAARVPGLEGWAGAHQQYAEDLLAWIEEAIGLLQDGELETYNERFNEVFGTDDPLGFNANVAAEIRGALESPALVQLGTLQQRAQLVAQAVDATEMTTAEQLGDDAAPG